MLRLRIVGLAACVLFGVVACGGNETESSPSGGTVSTGGGPAGTGGGGGTGGQAGNVTGGVGGGDPLGCPTPGPLLPVIGPWLNGPHPGPCASTSDGLVTTYVYDEAGTLLRGELDDGRTESYSYDAAGRITLVDGGTMHVEADYSTPGTLVVDWSAAAIEGVTTYTLDATGRPTTWTSPGNNDGEYLYEECRLVAADVTGPGGEHTTVVYHYDDAGDLVARDVNGVIVTFDYSCW